jgi:uracil-DNA glycosylase
VDDLSAICEQISADPSNAWARRLGYRPIYAASVGSRIAIIGQAPGQRAQESGVAWNDASGVTLRGWLGVTDEEFYDPDRFALLPMDFYYPGKGVHGDKPPRRDFAATWHPRILARLRELELTILIGTYAQKYYLGERLKSSLTETVRAYGEYTPSQLPLVHPSPLNFRWLAKNPWFESEVVPEARAMVRRALAD